MTILITKKSIAAAIISSSFILLAENKAVAVTASFNFAAPVENGTFLDFNANGINLQVANAVATDSPTAGSLNKSPEGLCTFYDNNAVATPFRCSSQVFNGGTVNSSLTGFTFQFDRDVFLKSFDVSLFQNLTNGSITFSGGSNAPQLFSFSSTSPQLFTSPFLAAAGTQINVATSGTIDNNASSGIFRINNLVVEEVPGPLPIFGALAGLGWSRKIKRKLSKTSN